MKELQVIYVHCQGAKNNMIGPTNTIWFSGKDGVAVFTDSSTGNTIIQNSNTNNGELGIHHKYGGNAELVPPSKIAVTTTSVFGTPQSASIVKIFSYSGDEGNIFDGTTQADNEGNFQWRGTILGPKLTATVTKEMGNAPEFSLTVITSIVENKIPEISSEFSLFQNYSNLFNPFTQINYNLLKSLHVSLNVYNIQG